MIFLPILLFVSGHIIDAKKTLNVLDKRTTNFVCTCISHYDVYPIPWSPSYKDYCRRKLLIVLEPAVKLHSWC